MTGQKSELIFHGVGNLGRYLVHVTFPVLIVASDGRSWAFDSIVSYQKLSVELARHVEELVRAGMCDGLRVQ